MLIFFHLFSFSSINIHVHLLMGHKHSHIVFSNPDLQKSEYEQVLNENILYILIMVQFAQCFQFVSE